MKHDFNYDKKFLDLMTAWVDVPPGPDALKAYDAICDYLNEKLRLLAQPSAQPTVPEDGQFIAALEAARGACLAIAADRSPEYSVACYACAQAIQELKWDAAPSQQPSAQVRDAGAVSGSIDCDDFWGYVIAYVKGVGEEGQALVDYINAWGRRLAAAQPSAQGTVTDWQPIETAPKDGSRILLGRAADEDDDRAGISTSGSWHEDDSDGPDNMGHDAGFMDDMYQEFDCGRSFGNPAYRSAGLQPTHWQPFPAAPAQQPTDSAARSGDEGVA